MKKTIIALLSAAFVAALLVPTMAATKPMKMDMKKSTMSRSTAKVAPKAKRHHRVKRHHKAKHVRKAMPVRKAWPTSMSSKPKHVHKAKVGDRSQSTTERGLNTSAGKAVKFTKKTLTVPQKHPEAAARPADRRKSTLQRGVGTSAHKAGKFIKKTLTPPAKK